MSILEDMDGKKYIINLTSNIGSEQNKNTVSTTMGKSAWIVNK